MFFQRYYCSKRTVLLISQKEQPHSLHVVISPHINIMLSYDSTLLSKSLGCWDNSSGSWFPLEQSSFIKQNISIEYIIHEFNNTYVVVFYLFTNMTLVSSPSFVRYVVSCVLLARFLLGTVRTCAWHFAENHVKRLTLVLPHTHKHTHWLYTWL